MGTNPSLIRLWRDILPLEWVKPEQPATPDGIVNALQARRIQGPFPRERSPHYRPHLVIIAFLSLLPLCAHADNRNVLLIEIPGPTGAKNEIWMRPYIAPAFEFRVEAGAVIPGIPIHCKQTTQINHYYDQVIILDCDKGIRLHLISVAFDAWP